MVERWLLTGGSGQVGRALRRAPPGGVALLAPSRSELDLARLPEDLSPWLEGVAAVVHCGAYTAVDRAERDAECAHEINAVATARLAAAAAERDIPLLYVSTDYVFPLAGRGPWRPDDPVEPAGVYARTKAEGEAAVRASGVRHAIIRTAWVVSADGANFVKTMLRLGAERERVRVVADQRGTPTHAGDLAAALGRIAQRFVAEPLLPSGTWHCVNAGDTTWHGLASHVFSVAASRGARVPLHVEAITTAEYPTPARRPSDSRLDASTLLRDFELSLRPWEEAVEEIVHQLVDKEAAA